MVEILQSPFCKVEAQDDSPSDDGGSDEDENIMPDEATEEMQPVVKSKKGTEIRFVGLDISQTLGTAFWTSLKIVLVCSRCKNQQEIEVKEER